MKKILLLLCVCANMAGAQNVSLEKKSETDNTERIVGRTNMEMRIKTRSGTDAILPDSIYTYNGKNKVISKGAAISYDEAGRKILEKGIIDRNSDALLNEEDLAYKIENVYTETGDMMNVEVVESHLENGEWKKYSKIIQIYNISNLFVPVEQYDYTVFNNDWLLFAKTIGTKYDEKGLPVVLMDTLFDTWSFTMGFTDVVEVEEVTRIEVEYNNDGMSEFVIVLIPDGESDNEGWIPYRKRENIYDGNKLMKDAYYFLDEDENWTYSYEYVYDYDDNGNVISMIRHDGLFGSEVHYKNVYLSGGNSNDVLLSVQSGIYPNPVSDVLYVKIEGADNAVITLVNAAGGIMIRQNTSLTVTSIPVQSFDKGYYFLIVQTDKNIKTHKVIIR